MAIASFRSSPPDRWTSPRPVCDASQRYLTHGPLQPMDYDPGQPGFWRRLFGSR